MSSSDGDPVRNLPLVAPPQPGERRAAGWQVTLTTVAIALVIAIVLWGINNQRQEGAGEQTATAQQTPVATQNGNASQAQSEPQSTQSQAEGSKPNNVPGTTGQGSSSSGGSEDTGGKSEQQPTSAGRNGKPTEHSDKPTQPR